MNDTRIEVSVSIMENDFNFTKMQLSRNEAEEYREISKLGEQGVINKNQIYYLTWINGNQSTCPTLQLKLTNH